MEFQTLKKSHKKQIVIGAIAICVIGGALTFATTRAKYKLTQDIPLVRGTVNYKMPDMRVVAVNISEDGTNYNIVDEIPTEGYNFNSEKSVCKVATETSGIENAPKDNNITLEYINGKINIRGVTKKGTRCYLYFDKERDTTKPTITNVTTSVTKTEINVTVTATDDKGVTEYWYQLNSNAAVKGTGNTHKFTGLTAGTTYTVKVYVKDAAGNQSDTTTKSVQTTPNPASETILGNITVKTGEPDFKQVATTDEGVYKVSDGMYGGYSYYWRGAVTNNYLKFGGFCWRIVRINGDKTIRLIYDGYSCHANGTSTAESLAKTDIQYNGLRTNASYVGWTHTGTSQRPSNSTSGTSCNAKTELESWYASTLASHESKIADGKYCNDRNARTSETWQLKPAETFYFAAQQRLVIGSPRLSCDSGDTYNLKIGIITSDEVNFAGSAYMEINKQFYLYNGQNYWTMSPNYWYGSYNYASVYSLNTNGTLGGMDHIGQLSGLRPVINLRADVTFSGGNGTLDNPYVVI